MVGTKGLIGSISVVESVSSRFSMRDSVSKNKVGSDW